jgi:glutathione S-transferase
VIHDGTKVVKDSWAIAQHLDDGLSRQAADARTKPTRASSTAGRHAVQRRDLPDGRGDMVDRVRPQDKDYIVDSRGKRLGTTDFAGFQAKAREKGWRRSGRARAGAARPEGAGFLSGDAPAYPDYILLGTFLWPRTISPLELLEKDDVVYAWRERMLDLFDGMARKAPAAA